MPSSPSRLPLIGVTGRLAQGSALGMPAGFADARVDAYLSEYAQGVSRAGGLPIHLPLIGDHAEAWADRIDALVLVGGADVGTDPIRDELELALISAMRAAGKPILGICRGAQLLNVAFGGALIADLPVGEGEDHADLSHPRATRRHWVRTTPGTLTARLYGEAVKVNSFHHQAVDVPGVGVVVSGHADDGVIEAIETPDQSVLGVQWHPEALDHDPSFRWLCERAGETDVH